MTAPKLLTFAKVGRYGPNYYLYLCRRERIRDEEARKGEGSMMQVPMHVYRVGEPVEIYMAGLSEKPSLAELRGSVMPFLDGAAEMEHVNVLFHGEPADMFVDEMGSLHGLPRNEQATLIYRAAWLRAHPGDAPESLPWIAGPAVLFTRKVWT